MTDSENRIRIHEGSIVLPNGFEDRTTNLFVPVDTAAQPNLSVARDWLKDGEALAPYIDRQIALLKSRLQGHRVLSRQAERLGPEIDGLPGERIDAAYRNGPKTVFQRQGAFIVAPGSRADLYRIEREEFRRNARRIVAQLARRIPSAEQESA